MLVALILEERDEQEEASTGRSRRSSRRSSRWQGPAPIPWFATSCQEHAIAETLSYHQWPIACWRDGKAAWATPREGRRTDNEKRDPGQDRCRDCVGELIAGGGFLTWRQCQLAAH